MSLNTRVMTSLYKLNLELKKAAGANLFEMGLTGSEFLILSQLKTKGSETIQNLGKRAMITSGTMTYTINKLIESGFVEKNQDDTDGRIYHATLTAEGSKRFKRIWRNHMKFLDNFLEDISDEEKTMFIEKIKYIESKIRKEKD